MPQYSIGVIMPSLSLEARKLCNEDNNTIEIGRVASRLHHKDNEGWLEWKKSYQFYFTAGLLFAVLAYWKTSA